MKIRALSLTAAVRTETWARVAVVGVFPSHRHDLAACRTNGAGAAHVAFDLSGDNLKTIVKTCLDLTVGQRAGVVPASEDVLTGPLDTLLAS